MTDPSGSGRVGVEETARAVLAALDGGETVATVVVLPSGGERSGAAAGPRLLVWGGRHAGSLGDPALEHAAVMAARERLSGGEGAETVELSVGAERVAIYIEVHRAPAELVIVGAGHIARPLCRIGAMLGFRVTVLDDRPEFATRERFPEVDRVLQADFSQPFREVRPGADSYLVLVTRGHKYDFDVLLRVLSSDDAPAYIGMVGSQRRVRATFEQLAREGIPTERLLRVHAPIGLDIGAETPEEIAVAIAAEIVRVRRGGTAAPLRDRARVVERWIRSGGF